MSVDFANFNQNSQTTSSKLPTAILSNDLGNRQQATGNMKNEKGNRQHYTHLLNNHVNKPIAYIHYLFSIYLQSDSFSSYYFLEERRISTYVETPAFSYKSTKGVLK